MLVNNANLQTLFVAFSAAFQKGFGQGALDHELFVTPTTSTTAEEEYGFLGEDASLVKWVGERTIQSIQAHGYRLQNEKFERTVAVPRDIIEDDKHGIFGMRFETMGRAAGAHPCELSYAALKGGFENKCFDGQYFFDTDHPVDEGNVQSNSGGGAGSPWFLIDANAMLKPIIFQTRRPYTMTRMDDMKDENVFMRDEYLYGVDARVQAGYGLWQSAYGSKQPLTDANYEAARAAMLSFKNDAGRPMGCVPTHLICAPANEKEALELLNADRNAAGATNVWRGTAKLQVSPWLS